MTFSTIIDEHAYVPVGVAVSITLGLCAIIWNWLNRDIKEIKNDIKDCERRIESQEVRHSAQYEKLTLLLIEAKNRRGH